MTRRSVVAARMIFSALSVSSRCNNYDLLSRLENPGQSTSGGFGPRNLRILVTSADYNGALGGVSGADAKCVMDAANPMGPGNGSWKALLVGGGRVACSTAYCSGGSAENIDWVLKPNTYYIRPDGSAIGNTDPAGIFVFPLNSPIADLTTTFAWTGLAFDWKIGTTCSGWTDNTSITGDKGQVDKNDAQAIHFASATCGTSQRLYCVEQ